MAAGVAGAASETKEVVIVANDALRLSVTHIEASPGQTVHVVLRNEGNMPKATMAHNWVLLKQGKEANAYSMAAVAAVADGYQPKALAGEVLASIPPVGPHENGEVTFTAPTIPGRYEFLCSYPAHAAAGMRGELVVR